MNQKELKELIEFLIEKDIAEFELERGDVKVRIKRAGEHFAVHAHGEPRFYAVPPAPTAPAVGAPAAAPGLSAAAPAPVPEETFHMVKSPIVGTFYESPYAGSASLRQSRRYGGRGAGALHRRGYETAQRD